MTVGLDSLFEEIVADAFDRPMPSLTPRAARLAWVTGKADVVMGMRRAGKTWFAFQKMQELLRAGEPREALLYVNFDDERLGGLAASDLGRLLDAYYRRWPALRDRRCFLFFDEIQEIAGWEKFVRRVIDTEDVHVCITGSSAKLLSSEMATSMRGRALSTELFPFDFRESLAHAKSDVSKRPGKRMRAAVERHLDDYLVRGGFPEAQDLDERRRVQLLQGYVDLVILRDVIERHAVASPLALRRFVRQLMNAPASLVSIHRVHNDLRSQGVAVSKDTLHAFLDHLTDAYLFFAVPIASDSERVRQSNPRKVYGIDPGLVRACTSRQTSDVGRLLETFVFLELRRRSHDIAYMRSKDGYEADFVFRDAGRARLVQACADLSSPETRARELRATEACMKELSLREATIVTLRQEETIALAQHRRIHVQPAWAFALGLV